MAKFWKEAALHYCDENGIKPKKLDEKSIVGAIEEFVESAKFKCGDCKSAVHATDIYCWYCGADVSPDGAPEEQRGGFAALQEAERRAAESLAGNKQTTKRKTGKPKKEEEPSQDDIDDDLPPEDLLDEEIPPEEDEKRDLVPTDIDDGKVIDEEGDGDFEEETVEQHISKIRVLSGAGVAAAWEVGRRLAAISNKKLWASSHKSFSEFCEKELAYTYATAQSYIRVSQYFDKEKVRKLSLFQAQQLASRFLSDQAREKLYLEAPKLSASDLKKKVSDIKRKQRQKDRPDGAALPGRKPGAKKKIESPLMTFVGSQFKGRYMKGEEGVSVVEIDDFVGLQVKVLKTGIRVEFVSLAKDDAGMDA